MFQINFMNKKIISSVLRPRFLLFMVIVLCFQAFSYTPGESHISNSTAATTNYVPSLEDDIDFWGAPIEPVSSVPSLLERELNNFVSDRCDFGSVPDENIFHTIQKLWDQIQLDHAIEQSIKSYAQEQACPKEQVDVFFHQDNQSLHVLPENLFGSLKRDCNSEVIAFAAEKNDFHNNKHPHKQEAKFTVKNLEIKKQDKNFSNNEHAIGTINHSMKGDNEESHDPLKKRSFLPYNALESSLKNSKKTLPITDKDDDTEAKNISMEKVNVSDALKLVLVIFDYIKKSKEKLDQVLDSQKLTLDTLERSQKEEICEKTRQINRLLEDTEKSLIKPSSQNKDAKEEFFISLKSLLECIQKINECKNVCLQHILHISRRSLTQFGGEGTHRKKDTKSQKASSLEQFDHKLFSKKHSERIIFVKTSQRALSEKQHQKIINSMTLMIQTFVEVENRIIVLLMIAQKKFFEDAHNPNARIKIYQEYSMLQRKNDPKSKRQLRTLENMVESLKPSMSDPRSLEPKEIFLSYEESNAFCRPLTLYQAQQAFLLLKDILKWGKEKFVLKNVPFFNASIYSGVYISKCTYENPNEIRIKGLEEPVSPIFEYVKEYLFDLEDFEFVQQNNSKNYSLKRLEQLRALYFLEQALKTYNPGLKFLDTTEMIKATALTTAAAILPGFVSACLGYGMQKMSAFGNVKNLQKTKLMTEKALSQVSILRQFLLNEIKKSNPKLNNLSQKLKQHRQQQFERFKNKKEVYILSLDGGGVRGIIGTVLMEKIEQYLSKKFQKPIKIQDSFDYFAGTSTGALQAIALTTPLGYGANTNGHNIVDIKNLYLKKGLIIFPESSGFSKILQRTAYHYQPFGLEDMLYSYYSINPLSYSIKPTLVTSVTVGAGGGKTKYFKSYSLFDASSKFHGKHLSEENIEARYCARATSAAPTYFPPLLLRFGEHMQQYVDGGMVKNNPSDVALREVLKICKKVRKIVIFSIGTGNVEQKEESRGLAIDTLINVVGSTTQTNSDESESAVYDLKQIAADKGIRVEYVRFNPSVKDIDLDNADPQTLKELELVVEKMDLIQIFEEDEKYPQKLSQEFHQFKQTCEDSGIKKHKSIKALNQTKNLLNLRILIQNISNKIIRQECAAAA